VPLHFQLERKACRQILCDWKPEPLSRHLINKKTNDEIERHAWKLQKAVHSPLQFGRVKASSQAARRCTASYIIRGDEKLIDFVQFLGAQSGL
jgi:hypothetical protein